MVDYFCNRKGIFVRNNLNFDLQKTFECGQCFRFEKLSKNSFAGVAFSRRIVIFKNHDYIRLNGVSEEDFIKKFIDYFDLNRDYRPMEEEISQLHPVLALAVKHSSGMRILNQDPWETLCSFIISQNNNIPRIKSIIGRLCQNFGERISEDAYSFPLPRRFLGLQEIDLRVLKCGFRARYILDAAKKVSNQIILSKLKEKKANESRKILMKILGVGPKVAECTLLFSLCKIDAFPVDTWIKKVMNSFFEGANADFFGRYAGLAGQYLFYYARTNPKILTSQF
ncbi:MAG: DNA-3-methyladenine glycosylase 2 family protein [Oscillospiraceae bacterium]|jgi:N-glycosylase/DNA lyase|nr:DNA-3-methyladenine glycosylase 2 family protein [Oscillospiraceae bacterium]